MMKYVSTLISVSDMEVSKRFYCDVLGISIVADYGENVTLDGGITLQTMDSWKSFINADSIKTSNAFELYFEEDDISSFCLRLKKYDINYIHQLLQHRWGQRCIRFYDPDMHIIEVGESLKAVCDRFMAEGLTDEEISKRMDVPIDTVKEWICGCK